MSQLFVLYKEKKYFKISPKEFQLKRLHLRRRRSSILSSFMASYIFVYGIIYLTNGCLILTVK